MKREAIRQLEPKGLVQLPTDADHHHKDDVVPTLEVITSRMAHLTDTPLFLYDTNFGGQVNPEESQSQRADILSTRSRISAMRFCAHLSTRLLTFMSDRWVATRRS